MVCSETLQILKVMRLNFFKIKYYYFFRTVIILTKFCYYFFNELKKMLEIPR